MRLRQPLRRSLRAPLIASPSSSLTGRRFKWFVDSVNGNDANDGRKVSTAFATLAAAMAVWGAGEGLGLVADSQWLEQLNYSAAGQFAGKAGAGAKPIIKANSVAPNASFSAATQPNVYKITWAHNVTPAATTFLSVWEGGVKLIRVASEAACSALSGSFWVNGSVASSSSTVMVHPKGDTNPASDGKLYEITARDYCVKSTQANAIVEDLVGIGCGHNDGVIVVEDGVIRRCEGYDGQKHIFFLANGLGEDLIAVGVEDNSTVYVAYDGDPTSNNVIWLRCYADGALPDASLPVQGVTGFYAHSASFGVLYQSITLIDCEAVRCSVGHSQDASVVVSLRFKGADNKVHIRCGVSGGAVGSALIQEPYVDGRGSTSTWDSDRVVEFNLQTARLEGGVVFSQERANDKIAVYCGTACDLTLENVTLVGPDSRPAYGVYRNGTGVLTVNRVIFKGINTPFYSSAGGLAGMVATNNVYHRTSGSILWNDNAGSYATFAAWKATGRDADGVNADPVFANSPSTWTTIADAAITAPAAVNLMAGATYYGVPRIAPQITSLGFSGGPLAGLTQTAAYTATGTPGFTPTFSWKLNGVEVGTGATYTGDIDDAGALTLTLALLGEGGTAVSTTDPTMLSAAAVTLDVQWNADTATQEGVVYADIAAWLAAKATFTRNLAGCYYTDLAGALTTRAANVPRYGDAGLLYEPSRTNSLARSQELNAAGWGNGSSGTVTATADDAAAPDGTTTAEKLASNNNGNSWWQRNTSTGWATKTVVQSVWIKGTGAFTGELIFSFSGAGTRQRANIAVTTDMLRRSMTATFVSGDTSTLQPSVNIGASHESWAWGYQVEEIPAGQLAQPTSYIPTTTAAVTRPADQLTLNLPDVTNYALLTFDNDNQQVIPNITPNYTLTNTLDRYSIKRLRVLSAA